MLQGEFKTSKAYQSLLAEDFRKRVYPIAFVTSLFMFVAALLNITASGNPVFFVTDLWIAVAFIIMGVLVKLGKLKAQVVAITLLIAFFALYVMTLTFEGTVHGILFNYTVVPFVAFFISGLRVGRIYTLLMLATLLLLWLLSLLDMLDIAYDNRELGMFFLSLCFSVVAAWFFETIRERAFYQSYQQSLEYDALMNAIDEVHYRVDMQGIIQKIGGSISKFTDFEPQEVVGQPISLFYAFPEERSAYIDKLKKYGKVTNYPITIKGKQHQHVNISMNAAIMYDENGEPKFIEGVFRDVTQEVQYEKERQLYFEYLQKLSRVEAVLVNSNLKQALQDIPTILCDIFQAQRCLIAPVIIHDTEKQEYPYFMFEKATDSAFEQQAFLTHHEMKFCVTSFAQDILGKPYIMNGIHLFSSAFATRFKLETQVIAFIKTSLHSCWMVVLHNFADKLDQQDTDLFMAVTKRLEATLNQFVLQKDLEKAVRVAEVASKAKGEFVATISHELRTPLHGVIGLLDMMEEDAHHLPPEQQQNLALAQASTRVLRSLIDDVLDLSKIESGHIDIQKQAFQLKQALIDALIPFAMKARDKGIRLSLEMADVAEVVEGDVQRLRQVLLNLVGNAIKFTHEGYVRIVVNQDNESLFIHIEDSGIGIASERQAYVFQPFSQVHDVHILGDNLQEKGTGLGTTISQYFVKMMGGDLMLRSEPGVGSTMTICLPLQQVGSSRISVSLQADGFIKASRARPPLCKHESKVKPWRILLAEDDPVGRRVAVKRLQRAGFHVDTATDGVQAYEKLKQENYDLLLTDIRMPSMDGLQLTKNIRDDEARLNKPALLIVGLSAYAMQDVKQEALEAGMTDFISKPVDMQVLITMLEQHVEHKKTC